MSLPTNTVIRNSDRPGLHGALAAVVTGMLATLLTTGAWAFLATVIGGHSTSAPLHWTLLSGAALGFLASRLRNRERGHSLRVLGAGLVVSAIWLVVSGGRPIGMESSDPFWAVGGTVINFALAAQLTVYALRDLRLARMDRHAVEVLGLRYLRAVGFTAFTFIVALPFYFMVVASLKSRAEMLQNPTFLGIRAGQTLESLLVGYREVLFTYDFVNFIGNSALVSVITVVITLTMAILGAYAVTRLQFRGRDLMSRGILLIYMFPAIVLVIPLYTVFTQLGLRNSLVGLLLVYPATTIPVALYMLRGHFMSLPRELEEAGLIDGCSRVGVIWRITLPLSLPALASVALYVFMIAWNEFLFAFMFLDTPAIFTLSRGMAALNSQEVPRQFLMAGAVIVTVPIMVLFFWFEKYLVGGLTSGGVKG